nr:hypothetical protein Iba_chr03eCG8000 [Ipomoea batatas]GME14437.1 hypothetical protein Iba_scaffold15225CG0160 [Ipomoea batatas]
MWDFTERGKRRSRCCQLLKINPITSGKKLRRLKAQILLVLLMELLQSFQALLLKNLLNSHMKNLQVQLVTSASQIRLVRVALVLSTMPSLEERKQLLRKWICKQQKNFLLN